MTDSTLPQGWASVPLAELLTGIETGKSFKCDERPPRRDEIGVAKVSAVSWGEYQELESKTCKDESRINPALFVRPGDFLFSRANTIELVGACVIARQSSLRIMLSDKILRLKFADEAFKPWALYFLRSKDGRAQIEALSSGNQESMRNIGQERLRQIKVPVPPADEQTRIVAKLEELLSDLDAGVAELKAAQAKLAQYRQSLLKAAVEGALTADWRARRAALETGRPAQPAYAENRPRPAEFHASFAAGQRRRHETPPTGGCAVQEDGADGFETGAQLLARILTERRTRWEARQLARFQSQGKTPPKGWQSKYPEPVAPDTRDLPELPEGWVWASLDQLSHLVRNGLSNKPSTEQIGFPILRINAVRPMRVDLNEVRYLPIPPEEASDYVLDEGDLLATRYNGSVDLLGVVGLVRGLQRPTLHPDKLIRIKPVLMRFMGDWMEVCAATGYSRAHVVARAKTTAGQTGISGGDIKAMPVPLPPLAEQAQIIESIQTEMANIATQKLTIEGLLKQSAAQRQNLLKAAFSGQLGPQDPNDEPASVLLERIRALQPARASRGRKKVTA